jgi:hypothetical protein
VLERRLLRSPGITLRDRRNRDDAVSRARRSPSAVKHDAEERLLVAAAEERAVRRENVHRLARCNIHAALLITGSGAQAPLHSDVDVKLAYEYALTRVNFRDPGNSKLVVRMVIDPHNCFGENCGTAGKKMLAAVNAFVMRLPT